MSGVGNTATGATIFTDNTVSGGPNDVSVSNLVVEQDMRVDGNFEVGTFSIDDLTVNNDLNVTDDLTVGGNVQADYVETTTSVNVHGSLFLDNNIVGNGLSYDRPLKRLRVDNAADVTDVLSNKVTVTNGTVTNTHDHNKINISNNTGTRVGHVHLTGTDFEVGTTTAHPVDVITNNVARLTASATGDIAISNTTASTTTTTGALTVAGGAGIAGAVNAGALATSGTISTSNTTNSTSSTTGAILSSGGIGASGTIWSGQAVRGNSLIASTLLQCTSATNSTNTITGALVVAGGVGIGNDVNIGGAIKTIDTTASTSTTTGALVVAGGAGFGGSVNIGGSMTSDGISTYSGQTPSQILQGSFSVSVPSNGTDSTTVTFSPVFSAIPRVVATCSGNTWLLATTSSASATSFSGVARNLSGSSVTGTFHWIAFGPT